MRSLYFALTIVLGVALFGVTYLTREVLRVNDVNQKNLIKTGRQLAQSIYQLGFKIGVLEKEKERLAEELGVKEGLVKAQKLFIGVQEQVAKEQIEKIGGLKNDLGSAQGTILELKKLGGEPLPKDFINKLLQATVKVRCLVSHADNALNYKIGSGSIIGRYAAVGNKLVVMTNAHVMEPNETTGNPECDIVFKNGDRYLANAVRRVSEGRLDFGFLSLEKAIDDAAALTSYEEMGVGFCEVYDVELGDRVTILSYPAFVGPEKIVSEGEIVDFLRGPIYETTATIEEGSSGGVALLNKKRCVLGMPTWRGIADNFGFSYVQSWPMMLLYK